MGILNGSRREAVYAGCWIRFAAMVMDGFILWIPGLTFRWMMGPREMPRWIFECLDFLQLTCLWALYYGFLESSKYQGTIGKILLGLKVTDMEGNKLSFGRACGRFLAQMISALPCGIGFLMIAWTERKQGLHDMIARCLVVRSGRYRTVRAVNESGVPHRSVVSLFSRLVRFMRGIVRK